MAKIQFWVDGEQVTVDEWPASPLLWVLQVKLGLMDGLYPCGIDQCGECAIEVEGHTLRACKTPLARVDGKEIALVRA
jgi:isoquinoline 1-oxidoreductase alpha subunit